MWAIKTFLLELIQLSNGANHVIGPFYLKIFCFKIKDKSAKHFTLYMIKVLLVCDFYETRNIPDSVFVAKENIALFPISNIPLIEYILGLLYQNGLYEVILAGSSLSIIRQHLEKTKYDSLLRISYLSNSHSSFGDILREADEADWRIDHLLVYFANTFVNYDLQFLVHEHLRSKEKDESVIVTTILFDEKAKKRNNVYTLHDSKIVYYDEQSRKKRVASEFWDVIEKYDTVNVVSNVSKSRVFVVSSEIFPLFTENFDYRTIEDLIIGLQVFNAYGYKINAILSENIPYKTVTSTKDVVKMATISLNTLSFTSQVVTKYNSGVCPRSDVDGNTSSQSIAYGKSIITLRDYFDMNMDFRLRRFSPFSLEDYIDYPEKHYKYKDGNYMVGDVHVSCFVDKSVLGESEINANITIKSSNICDGCVIKADVQDCILWDGVMVCKNLTDCLVVSNNDDGIIGLDQDDLPSDESEVEGKEVYENSFFTDVVNYLVVACVDMLYLKMSMDEIMKEIGLLRIVWNASRFDLVEAFGIFLAKIYDSENEDDSTLNASLFFPILTGMTDDLNAQDLLLESIDTHLSESDCWVRMDIVTRYGFLLLEDGLISRGSIKKYRNLVKENQT